MSAAAEFSDAYRGLLEHGRLVCRVEDAHRGRWWPSYALRALRHRELGQCRKDGWAIKPWRCADCAQARSTGFLP